MSPKAACQLSEMTVIKPSKVLELVPEAKLTQIAEFLKIAEEGYHNPKDVMPKKCESPEPGAGTSQLDWLKKKVGSGDKKSQGANQSNGGEIRIHERAKENNTSRRRRY